MTTAEEAVLARREAVQHLEKLFHSPDDLRKLEALLAETHDEQQANKSRLSAALSAQVRDLRGGLDNLARAEEALAAFESGFASIEALCAESASLVDAGADIRRLGTVHSNMRQTIKNAELVAALPAQAAEAERLLAGGRSSSSGGENSIVRAYLCAAELEATVVKVQLTLDTFKAQQGSRQLSVPSLEFYFAQVRRAMAAVEDRLWAVVRGFRRVARQRPALLVAALQVVEIQEGVERELLAAGQGGSKLRKGWRSRCMQQLASSLQESFAPLLQRCSKLLAEDAAVEELLKSVLQEAKDLVGELQAARDHVHGCFPPHYAVLPALCGELHSQIGSLLDLVGLSASRLSNKDILVVLRWVEDYQVTLQKISNKTATAAPLTSSLSFFDNSTGVGGEAGSAGVSLLLKTYVNRVSSTLVSWLNNIVEADFKAEPEQDADGRLWTPAPVDLFRILDEQLAVAAPAGPALIRRVATEASRMLRSFQQATTAKLSSATHTLEVLCAVANNAHRCRELGLEFAARARSAATTSDAAAAASSAAADDDALTEACVGFDAVVDAALVACAGTVFGDPGFEDLFGRVGCTNGWTSGSVTGSVLATLEDFMRDFNAWLYPQVFSRLVGRLLSETTAHFVAAVTMQLRSVEEADVKALRRDATQIAAFFGALVPAERANAECQALSDITDFVSSDSVEAFELSYTALLGSAPGISPVLLSNLLAARVNSDQDMTKGDAKEVLEACRQVYKSRKPSAVASALPAVKGRVLPTTRDAAFLAALSAARKKPGIPSEGVGSGGSR